MDMEQEMGKRFARKPVVQLQEGGSLEFNGSTIQLSQGIYSINQNFHTNHLSEIMESSPIDKTTFISQRARGAYIASVSRPYLTVGFAILAKCQDPTVQDNSALNKLIRNAKMKIVRFNFSKLDTSTIRLAVFTYTSFTKNKDLSLNLDL